VRSGGAKTWTMTAPKSSSVPVRVGSASRPIGPDALRAQLPGDAVADGTQLALRTAEQIGRSSPPSSPARTRRSVTMSAAFLSSLARLDDLAGDLERAQAQPRWRRVSLDGGLGSGRRLRGAASWHRRRASRSASAPPTKRGAAARASDLRAAQAVAGWASRYGRGLWCRSRLVQSSDGVAERLQADGRRCTPPRPGGTDKRNRETGGRRGHARRSERHEPPAWSRPTSSALECSLRALGQGNQHPPIAKQPQTARSDVAEHPGPRSGIPAAPAARLLQLASAGCCGGCPGRQRPATRYRRAAQRPSGRTAPRTR